MIFRQFNWKNQQIQKFQWKNHLESKFHRRNLFKELLDYSPGKEYKPVSSPCIVNVLSGHIF